MTFRLATLGALTMLVGGAWTAAASVAQDAGAGLLSTEWRLTALNGTPFVQPPNFGHPSFELADNRLSGSTGCNSIRSGYPLDGQSLTFGVVMTTKKYCRAGFETEQAFLSALKNARGYEIVGDTLVLTGADGSPLAEFAAAAN